MKRKNHFELGIRERQLVETVYRLGEASVSQVLESLDDKPKPSYSTVRTILNKLVRKKVLASKRDGIRFFYRPRVPQEQTQTNAMLELVDSLYDGSVMNAIVSLLDISGQKLSDADYDRLTQLIHNAKNEGR